MTMLYKGTNIAQQATRYSWNRNRGWNSFPAWHGSYEQGLLVIANLQATTGAEDIAFEPLGDGTYMVRASSTVDSNPSTPGAVEEPVNKWDLLGQSSPQDIKLHPKSLALGIDLLTAIHGAYSEIVKETDVVRRRELYTSTKALIAAEATLLGKSAVDAVRLFDHFVTEHNTYLVPIYVLAHQKTVTRRWTGKVSFTNMPRNVYPCDGTGAHSSALITELVAAGTPIDPELFFELSDIPKDPEREGYIFGWVKQPPTSRLDAYEKRVIAQEYHLDSWSNYIFDPV